MIAIVIDFSEKVNKFLDLDIGFFQIITDYYLHFIPWINGLLWPLFALIAVIFFTSRLAKNSEIISILSAGVSYNRIVYPYFLSALVIGLLMWIGNNYIIPNSTRLKSQFEQVHLKKSILKTLGNDIHFYVSPDEKIYLRYYRKRDTTGINFRFEKFDSNKQLSYYIKAGSIEILEPPNKWRLKNIEKRWINDLNEKIVIDRKETLDTILNLTHDDFILNSNDMISMTSPELIDYIQRDRSKGLGQASKYQVELHRRTAEPITAIILTLIGLIVSSRKVRGGMGLHLAIGMGLGGLFVVLSKFATTFSNNLSLAPVLGVWIPNIIFLIITAYLFKTAQK